MAEIYVSDLHFIKDGKRILVDAIDRSPHSCPAKHADDVSGLKTMVG